MQRQIGDTRRGMGGGARYLHLQRLSEETLFKGMLGVYLGAFAMSVRPRHKKIPPKA